MEYEIKQITSNFIGGNCYLINFSDHSIIIDPCVDLKMLNKYGLKKLSAILITHAHVDHILYLKQLAKEFNCLIYLHKNALEKIYNDNLNLSVYFNNKLNIKKDDFIYQTIADNQIIKDDVDIKCITTPGHTNCSVCYLIENNLFTGDTLFNKSVGRTDFPTGNTLELRNSLKKILSFNQNFIIYPGHDDVSCIDEQKKYNYYLKF